MAAAALTAGGPERLLADGNEIPLLGLGVWQVRDGRECEETVRAALEAGYRHIDTAQAYGNEASVGRALRDSGVPREEVFVTTKFDPAHEDAEAEAQRSLERLSIDQLDLYIIHWPQGGPTWAWPGMERAHERGYARSIGVSNYSVRELDELMEVAQTPPVLNQVQFSPFEYRCAGACSGSWSWWSSRPTARESRRTPGSSTSRCPRRTWTHSTRSTRRTAPSARWSAAGGEAAREPPGAQRRCGVGTY
jgi:hypothetical protein